MTTDKGFELHPGAAVDITDIWEFIAKTMPNNYRIDRVSERPIRHCEEPLRRSNPGASACAAPASPYGRTAAPGLLRFARNDGQGKSPSSCLLSFTVAVVLGSWPQFFVEGSDSQIYAQRDCRRQRITDGPAESPTPDPSP